MRALCLLLALALAGCAGVPADPEPAPGTASATSEPTAAAPAPVAVDPAPNGAAAADPFAHTAAVAYQATECRNPRAFWMVDKAKVQPYLPPGFVAANFTDAFRSFRLPVPELPEQQTPQTLVMVDGTVCPTLKPTALPPGVRAPLAGQVGFANLGVFVEQPDIPGVQLSEALVEVYLLSSHWTDPVWAELHQRLGFAPAEAATVTLDSDYGVAPDGPTDGHATIVDAAGPLASFTYHFPPRTGQPNLEESFYRYWHVSGGGTLMVANVQSDETVFGPLDQCSHRAGSWYETLLGVQECATPQLMPGALVGLGDKTAFKVTMTWMPGVFPRP